MDIRTLKMELLGTFKMPKDSQNGSLGSVGEAKTLKMEPKTLKLDPLGTVWEARTLKMEPYGITLGVKMEALTAIGGTSG